MICDPCRHFIITVIQLEPLTKGVDVTAWSFVYTQCHFIYCIIVLDHSVVCLQYFLYISLPTSMDIVQSFIALLTCYLYQSIIHNDYGIFNNFEGYDFTVTLLSCIFKVFHYQDTLHKKDTSEP